VMVRVMVKVIVIVIQNLMVRIFVSVC
jgi:hypothetical protein